MTSALDATPFGDATLFGGAILFRCYQQPSDASSMGHYLPQMLPPLGMLPPLEVSSSLGNININHQPIRCHPHSLDVTCMGCHLPQVTPLKVSPPLDAIPSHQIPLHGTLAP